MHQYTYDAAGRPSSHVAPEGTVTYEYDANGNMVKITDSKGIRTRAYDYMNRVTSYTDAEGNTIQYDYDEFGKPITLTYPDGTAVHYEYDAVGNLSKVTDWNQRVTQYYYDENNKLSQIFNANGTSIDVSYDSMQRMIGWQNLDNVFNDIMYYSLEKDGRGRIIGEYNHQDENDFYLEVDRNIEYNYDETGWVTYKGITDNFTQDTTTVETFAYDEAGNMAEINGAADFVYDANNRLISYLENPLTYDADGNLLFATIDDEAQTFAYDSHNRLISAGGITYEYDPQNLRIKQSCGGDDTIYIYDPLPRLPRLLVRESNSGVSKYVYGLGLIGEETEEGDFLTYHYDYRGSTVAITDEDGEINEIFEYDTYGKLLSHSASADMPFLYNGRDGVMTEPNGLYYMRARYYSPDLKRFINADIIPGDIANVITLNRYAYANNNPISFVDPRGLSAERGGPTVLEAAYMAQHVYDIGAALPEELQNSGWFFDDHYEKNGLFIGIYKREANGIVEYAVVNRGTISWDITYTDIWNNFLQPIGYSKNVKDSVQFARRFIKEHSDAHVTFVGHSKGGAEAISNAMATNSNAIVFNPAPAVPAKYGLENYIYTANMTAYVVQGEAVSFLSFIAEHPAEMVLLNPPMNSKNVDLFTPGNTPLETSKNYHSMDAVIDSLIDLTYKLYR